MTLSPFRFFALVSALAALGSQGLADVLVVDGTVGSTYSDPQAAIDAAADGDTILITAGGYSGFTVDGKSLAVLADSGLSVPISGRVVVRNLTATQRVRIGGLVVLGQATGSNCPNSPDESGEALLVENAVGSVRIMDCSFRGADAGLVVCGVSSGYAQRENGYDGARLVQALDIAFDNCDLFGGEGLFLSGKVLHQSGNGGCGVDAQESLVAFHHCVIRGGRGGTADLAGEGGIAYWARGLGGLVSGSILIGGDSGFSTDSSYAPPLPGGDAIRADFGSDPAAGVQVQHLDSQLQGGAGSTASSNPYVGTRGASFGGPGQEVDFSGLAPELDSPRVVRENSTLTLVIEGQPGHQAFLIQSGQTRFRPISNLRGIQLVGQGAGATFLETRWFYQGLIPSSGALQVSLQIPDQGAGFEADLRRYQVFTFLPAAPSTTGALGDFAEITILDDTY